MKTHNLTLLFVMSGLRPAFDQKRTTDATFVTASNWLNDWNEGLRYRSPGMVTKAGINRFLAILDGPTGMLAWIKQH